MRRQREQLASEILYGSGALVRDPFSEKSVATSSAIAEVRARKEDTKENLEQCQRNIGDTRLVVECEAGWALRRGMKEMGEWVEQETAALRERKRRVVQSLEYQARQRRLARWGQVRKQLEAALETNAGMKSEFGVLVDESRRAATELSRRLREACRHRDETAARYLAQRDAQIRELDEAIGIAVCSGRAGDTVP